jgi:hypothetical protein
VQTLFLTQTALPDGANSERNFTAEPKSFYLPHVLLFQTQSYSTQILPPLILGHTNPFLQTQIGLPGLKKDEVHINVEHYPAGKRRTEINMPCHAPLLRITAHHEQEEGDQSRFWEDVDTRIQLPEGTDPDQVDAEVG